MPHNTLNNWLIKFSCVVRICTIVSTNGGLSLYHYCHVAMEIGAFSLKKHG